MYDLFTPPFTPPYVPCLSDVGPNDTQTDIEDDDFDIPHQAEPQPLRELFVEEEPLIDGVESLTPIMVQPESQPTVEDAVPGLCTPAAPSGVQTEKVAVADADTQSPGTPPLHAKLILPGVVPRTYAGVTPDGDGSASDLSCTAHSAPRIIPEHCMHEQAKHKRKPKVPQLRVNPILSPDDELGHLVLDPVAERTLRALHLLPATLDSGPNTRAHIVDL